tara:strand:+ start:5559 stop:6428 length:870 start_codon:yes stop_codon:yes gene_type:complete
VAKLISMPTSPNFIRSDWSLVRTVGTTVSPFTGKTKTQEFDGVYWTADVALPPMRRSQAVEWQSFLLELNGTVNHFKFADPDALTNTGTYSTGFLTSELRTNESSVTLSFSNQTITAGASTFSGAKEGDFIVVTGATNEDNNGTHKITTVTSNTVVVTSSTFTTESNTASCKVRTNVKGATGLSLLASTNAATGTIKKGDYLSIQSAASSTGTPAQLVMVTEDATATADSGKDFYGVAIQPKLRSDLATGHYAVFTNPKGTFRLTSNEVSWSADRISNYGISFSCIEVI